MFEQSEIAHYLLSLGVVKPRAVIDEDFTVVDVSRRNCVFLARTRHGPALVVKQEVAGDGSSLAHEAAVLRLLAAAPAVSQHVPRVVHEEPGGSCLVLQTPRDARDWSDHRGRFPRLGARVLGGALAALHDLRVDAPTAPDPAWGLLIPEPPRSLVLELSAGAQDLVGRIQASDFVCSRLAELRATGGDEALIHGDLRWENCLALPAPRATRRTRVLLVDWELAGQAEPAFDVGSVFAEYLRVWAGSVPIVEPSAPDRLVAWARHPLTAMRPAIGAFWRGYQRARTRPPSLGRTVELAGVRLLQTAVERAQTLNAPTAHVIMLVQLAENILRRPDDAAQLLGLRA